MPNALALALLLALPRGISRGEGDPPTVAIAASSNIPAERGKGPGLALDADTRTAFETSRPPDPDDDFTLRFAGPVEVSRIVAITGKAEGGDRLESGLLEISEDGDAFPRSSSFFAGVARIEPGKAIRAIRIRPTGEQAARLAIREILIDSPAKLARPEVAVRVRVDTSEVPELEGWGAKAKDLCERWQPKIARLLASDGDTPPHEMTLVFKKDMEGVAFASGTTITIAADWVKAHPDDLGMVIHELTHVVQSYPANRPGWLVEGIADYVRIVHFEPDAPRPPIDPDTASYRDAYKTTAAFLAWLETHHDNPIVSRLNLALRRDDYDDALFETLAGKPLDDLWREFADSLRPAK